MKRELDYITIEGALGWDQHWFQDWSMYFGGCAAVTACDLCIYLAKEKGLSPLYPYDPNHVTKEDYLALAKIMKRYLTPRLQGIDTLPLYSSGLFGYWQKTGVTSLEIAEVSGALPWTEGRALIKMQIDSALPVPFLLLRHKNPSLKPYQWHWFNLAGYEEHEGDFSVKAVTYGSSRWLNLKELWDSGHKRRGGFIRIVTPEAPLEK